MAEDQEAPSNRSFYSEPLIPPTFSHAHSHGTQLPLSIPQPPVTAISEHWPADQTRGMRPGRGDNGEHVLRAWAWELSSLAFAYGLLVAIFVILARENNNVVQGWDLPRALAGLNLVLPSTLTLNTLVALPSTLYRGALVTIAAEMISQTKWSWFWSALGAAGRW